MGIVYLLGYFKQTTVPLVILYTPLAWGIGV